MIKKPEDAVPRLNQNQPEEYGDIYFTAAECAEIARAYAQTSALWRNADTIPERRTLSVEVDAWLAKFAEWEGK